MEINLLCTLALDIIHLKTVRHTIIIIVFIFLKLIYLPLYARGRQTILKSQIWRTYRFCKSSLIDTESDFFFFFFWLSMVLLCYNKVE